jgi:hypothetical protein
MFTFERWRTNPQGPLQLFSLQRTLSHSCSRCAQGDDDEDEDDEDEDDMHPGMEEDLVDTQRLYGEFMDDGPGDMMLNGERDIDDLMQRVLENPHFQDMAEFMQSDDEGHQVLSLLVPGGRASNTRFLHDIFQDMQLIRYPPRGGRGGMGDSRNLPSMLHEVPATDHPMLSRRLEPSWRAGRGGSRSSAADLLGLGPGHGAFLMEDPAGPLGGAAGFFRRDGRFLFRVQGEVPQAPNGEDGRAAALSSRWTDDGVGLSAGTRGVLASNLEQMLTTALSRNAQPHQTAGSAEASDSQVVAAPAEAVAEAAPPSSALDDTSTSSILPSADLSAIQEQLARVSGDIDMLVRDIEAVTSEVRQQASMEGEAPQAASTSSAGQGQGQAAADSSDAMEEDDELQAALRLSMQQSEAQQEPQPPQELQASNAAEQVAASQAQEVGARPEAGSGQPVVPGATSIDPVRSYPDISFWEG